MISDNIDSYLNDMDINNIEDVDLVMTSGAWNGSYLYGSLLVIKKLEENNKMRIKRISCCSISSVLALLYLIDKLDLYNKLYEKFVTCYKERYHFENIDEILEIIRPYINNDKCKLLTKRLYISYFDVKECRQIVVNKYKNVDNIFDIIKKSCYLPYVTNKKIAYKKRYIDGIYPYIFRKSNNSKRIFINVLISNKFYDTIDIKNEKSPESRIIEGIIDMKRFLIKNRSTMMCSFIDNWGVIDLIKYKIMQMLGYMICYIICVIMLLNQLLNIEKNSVIFRYLYKLSDKSYKNYIKKYLV